MTDFKKKIAKSLLAATMAFVSIVTVGCGGKNNNTSESVDPSKTTLYVYNVDGGYRTEWLEQAAERYIELQKDVSWESGKTGVDIKIRKDRSGKNDQQIKNGDNDILFLETVDYYSKITNDVSEDITEVYTTPNKYDNGKKLIDKLTDDQIAYYGKVEGDSVKYYGIPSYMGSYGLSFNLDLFDKFGLYIRKGAEITDDDFEESWFIGDSDADKSAGPDGVEGTYDDGLPADYTEFFALCKFIIRNGMDPLVWSGTYAEQYITGFINSLVGQNEGAEQIALTYTTDGIATTLGKVVNGNWVADAEPTTIVNPAQDGGESAKQLARRKGIYDALCFWERLYTETFEGSNYYAQMSTLGLSQIQAEKYFLQAGLPSFDYKNYKSCAMLIDGVWWESEATDEFAAMEKQDTKYSKQNSNYVWMPLPRAEKAVAEDDDHPVQNTIYDVHNALCLVKKGTSGDRKALVIDFLQFLHSDAELVNYTKVTGSVKALKYEIVGEDLEALTTYGKSVVEVRNHSEIVYPAAQTEFMKKYITTFGFKNLYKATVGKTTYASPFTALKNNGIKATEYFNGIATYYNNSRMWS